jgi:hypothetical protein
MLKHVENFLGLSVHIVNVDCFLVTYDYLSMNVLSGTVQRDLNYSVLTNINKA